MRSRVFVAFVSAGVAVGLLGPAVLACTPHSLAAPGTLSGASAIWGSL